MRLFFIFFFIFLTNIKQKYSIKKTYLTTLAVCIITLDTKNTPIFCDFQGFEEF